MKKIFYLVGCVLLFSIVLSCSKDNGIEPDDDNEIIEVIEKVKFSLGVTKGEEQTETKAEGGSDPLMNYPYSQLFLTSSLLELGTLPITVNASGNVEFYLITTNEGKYYLSVSDDPNNLDDKMEVKVGNNIYFFKSHATSEVCMSLPEGLNNNPCNPNLPLCKPFGKDIYESKLFTMNVVDGKIKLSGDIFVRENGVDILKMDRLSGMLSPHILFFYKETPGAKTPIGLNAPNANWLSKVTSGKFTADLNGWKVMPYLDNSPSAIQFSTMNLSGTPVSIALEDDENYQIFATRTFGVQVDGDDDGFDLNTYYSVSVLRPFIFSSDYDGKNTKIRFAVKSPDNITKFLSVKFDIDMTKNCVLYYYVLVNIEDVDLVFYRNSSAQNSNNSNAVLRSSLEEEEIPVTAVWHEFKPLN